MRRQHNEKKDYPHSRADPGVDGKHGRQCQRSGLFLYHRSQAGLLRKYQL